MNTYHLLYTIMDDDYTWIIHTIIYGSLYSICILLVLYIINIIIQQEYYLDIPYYFQVYCNLTRFYYIQY